MDLKKDFLSWALVLLMVIAAIAIFDNLRTSKHAADLQTDRDHAAEKVSSLQVELENTLSEADELRNEQERLANAFIELENEVEAMKSPVLYQDFNEAINTVEAYKAVGTVQEAIKFIALSNNSGYSTLDSDGNCPCSITFRGRSIEWSPNVILELKEFALEDGKLALTYHTAAKLEHVYQFIMVKAEGWQDSSEKWRIEEIRLKDKE